MGSTTEYFCDLCKKGMNQEDFHRLECSVTFTTEQTEGRSTDPYLSNQKFEVCKECVANYTKLCPIKASGAMGFNDYVLSWQPTYKDD